MERAKKCLDFAGTAYIIHFIVVLVYSGFPSNFEWYATMIVVMSRQPCNRWVVNVMGLAAMAMLGEWLCLQCELREIPIGVYETHQATTPSFAVSNPGSLRNRVAGGVAGPSTGDRNKAVAMSSAVGKPAGASQRSAAVASNV